MPVRVADFEAHAARVLSPAIRDFIAGGSGGEAALRANRRALDAVTVTPRVLRGVTAPEVGCRLAGSDAALPVAIAPLAYHRLAHPDGEIATARAAAAAGIPFTVSTLTSVPLKEIAATGAVTWFQLYWLRDRDHRHELIRRAEDTGCRALVVTVDVPWMARRTRDLRHGFTLPPGVEPAELAAGQRRALGPNGSAAPGSSAVAAHTEAVFAPTQTWRDLAELRARSTLPLIVKGVLDPRDAVRAADTGADGVVVSNHGGRQLDAAPATADALAAVREALGHRCQLLMDGGIRSGTDVLRAFALGADGVLLGRPVLWALALAGADGVRHLLDLLAAEIRDAFGLAGCSKPADAREMLRPEPDRSGSWSPP